MLIQQSRVVATLIDVTATAAGSVAPRQEELLFTQTALLSRTTHISRRYAIKHADPKCHKQVRPAATSLPQCVQLDLTFNCCTNHTPGQQVAVSAHMSGHS